MTYTVPTLSIVFMLINIVIGIALPVFLFLFILKKYKASVMPFFIGCAVFVLFALVVEGSINVAILSSPIGAKIKGNIWLYGIFGGLMAGIFEETGRFTAFKTVLKKKRGNDANALMYGAGHGGIEAFMMLVIGMISNLVIAVMMNFGMADQLTSKLTDTAQIDKMNATLKALAELQPTTFLLSPIERFSAIALHISLSVLVWFAVKNVKKFWLFPLAILIHAFVDAFIVILHAKGAGLIVVMPTLYALVAVAVVIAVRVWKRNAVKVEKIAEPITV